MCPCLDRSRYFSLVSASKDAHVASDSQFLQGALDNAGHIFSPTCTVASYRRGPSPMPSSSGADSCSTDALLALLAGINSNVAQFPIVNTRASEVGTRSCSAASMWPSRTSWYSFNQL